MVSISLFLGCASKDKKVPRPYDVKTYTPGFDFSSLKKKSILYVNHSNGIYYTGKVNLEKSGPGLLCLYQGEGTKCFKQSQIKEITKSKSSGSFNGARLATNVMIVLVFVGLIYILPSN